MLTAKKKTKVRLSDIAREAGVSVMTVSEVLNPRSNSVRVSESTRKRIKEVAEALNYKPNQAARQLAGQSSNIIGVILDSRAPMSYYNILAAMEAELSKRNYRVLVGHSHNSPDKIETYIDDFRSRGVEGVIVISHDYPEYQEQMQKILGSVEHAVFISPPNIPGSCYVEFDIAGGIVESIRHLHERGRRRIALVNFASDAYSLRTRLNGYVEGLKTFDMPFEDRLVFRMPLECVEVSEMREYLPGVAERLIAEKVDAVIAINDHCAAILLNELEARGVRVPQDIAIVGINNDDVCFCTAKKLTSLAMQYDAVAAGAIELLLERIKSPDSQRRSKLIPTRLIVREST